MDSLQGLNEAQRQAVQATEGYIRVVAGAGTGKTRTLTRRYGYLVEAGGVSPGHILAVTFTNKAANEMKQRVRSMVGDGDTGYICTFHALGLMILKEDLHTLGWPRNFLVLDEEDKNSLLRTVFEDMGMTLKEMSLHKARPAQAHDDAFQVLLRHALPPGDHVQGHVGPRAVLSKVQHDPEGIPPPGGDHHRVRLLSVPFCSTYYITRFIRLQ